MSTLNFVLGFAWCAITVFLVVTGASTMYFLLTYAAAHLHVLIAFVLRLREDVKEVKTLIRWTQTPTL